MMEGNLLCKALKWMTVKCCLINESSPGGRRYDSHRKLRQIAIMKSRIRHPMPCSDVLSSLCANINWKATAREHSITNTLEWISNINIFPCSRSLIVGHFFCLAFQYERRFFSAVSVSHRPLIRSRGPFRQVSLSCGLLVEKETFYVSPGVIEVTNGG